MVVGPGEAVKGGGFLTGWKGIAIFISIITVATVLAITGIQAERNTFPRLSPAESRFDSGDYGLGPLYAPCITNGSFIGKQWLYDVPVPGTDGGTVEVVSLSDRQLLARLSGGGIKTEVRWNNNPEFVCFVICRIALGDRCTYFTYDGLDADSCRFGDPDYPMKEIQPSEPEDFLFVYNATCMQQRREQLVAPIEPAAPGLDRPNSRRALGSVEQAERLQESLLKNTQFMRGQWAGPLPVDYIERGGYPWRVPGFTDLGESCEEQVLGSFATGDHVVVTMASANQVGLLALSTIWWRTALGQLGALEARADRDELLRGAAYLISTWDAGANQGEGRIMLGVGDQLGENGLPLMYSDFGRADRALQIEKPPDEFAQLLPAPPQCTYTRANQPDPATAAHAAAALALGSIALEGLSAGGPVSPETMVEVAEELYQYSIRSNPIDGSGAAPAFNASAEYGASQLYPLDEGSPLQVYSHQLWAACALWQATGRPGYWNDTLEIYERYFDALDSELENSPLYNPSANYRNPQWYALLCMAQSAPEASNIAASPLLAVPEHVDPAAESPANETAAGWRAGQRAQYRAYLRAQLPETGTRLEVTRQLSNNFVWPWLTLESQAPSGPRGQAQFRQNDRLKASEPDNFHYFDLNGDDEGAVGTATVVRDSANAALVSLMFADLPGVDPEQAFQARCMAKQQVDFVLGENVGETTLQAFFGDAVPVTNFWHKDSACPDEEIRDAQFTPVRRENPDFDPNETESVVNRVSFSTRVCDFLTFFGNRTDPQDNPDLVMAYDELQKELPEVLDPVLDNPNDLVGAVAATFDVTGDTFFVNQRAICLSGRTDLTTCSEAGDQGPNPMTQVSIDTNAAFFGAVLGVVALPQEFWDRIEDCPEASDRAAAARNARTARIEADRKAIETDIIEEATQDPNLTIQGPDNGLRVPLREGAAMAVDGEDVSDEAAAADGAGRR